MFDFSFLTSVNGIITLLALSLLEIVLGIDNIIFISIISDKLPKSKQSYARNFGLIIALFVRVVLLFSITWLVGLTHPLFVLFNKPITIRGLILFAGGLFLTIKTIQELIHKITHQQSASITDKKDLSRVSQAIIQIVLIDIVFSFDSILTAVGLCNNNLALMISIVIIAMFIMILFAGPTSNFINRYSSVKTLALFFLVVIGVLLMLEGLEFHFDKGYIYFALGFSLTVELLNILEKNYQNKFKANK